MEGESGVSVGSGIAVSGIRVSGIVSTYQSGGSVFSSSCPDPTLCVFLRGPNGSPIRVCDWRGGRALL